MTSLYSSLAGAASDNTVSFWVKIIERPDPNQHLGMFFYQETGGQHRAWTLSYFADLSDVGKYVLSYRALGASSRYDYYIRLELNKWYKIDCVQSMGTTPRGSVFLNGNFLFGVNGDAVGLSSQHPFMLGKNEIPTNYGLLAIDEVVVQDVLLTETQVRRKYAWESRGYCTKCHR